MKNGEAGLCAIPANRKGKISRHGLGIVALIFLSLIIADPDSSRVQSQDARFAPIKQTKVEPTIAEREGAPESTKVSIPSKTVKPDIILPDIFISVPAEDSAPAENHSHSPAAEKRNF